MTLQAGSTLCCLQAEQHCPDRSREDEGRLANHCSRAADWDQAVLAAATAGALCAQSTVLVGAPA